MSVLACPLPAIAAEAPAVVFGQYSGTTCPKNDPACLPTKPSDLVHIARGPDGRAKVSVHIVFGQGNTCHLDGNAEWRGSEFVLRADGLEVSEPCELVARVQGSVLMLEDQGSRCQPVYCGVRGVLTGARFVKRR
jgi:hypothetical protein